MITARDVAGALHLVEVSRAAVRDPRFEVVVVAQEPAAARFVAAGLDIRTVAWPIAKPHDEHTAGELRRHARDLLREIEPDVVLTGLSTPFDAGLDEAVLAEARVPTALYQDFWGEQNLILGRGADHIFAIDEQAVSRNRERFGLPSVIVGSARHAAYAALDIAALRARGRRNLGIAPADTVVGFFGQALHALTGYERTVRALVEMLRGLPQVRLIVRPHPRENAAQRSITRRWFADAGLRFDWFETGPVEEPLLTCDCVISLFSTCTFDTAYLNRFAREPVAVPVSLLFDAEIAAYCRQYGNYLDFAHHTQGLVRPVYERSQLEAAVRQALTTEARRDVWTRAHSHLPDPARAAERVLDHLAVIADKPSA